MRPARDYWLTRRFAKAGSAALAAVVIAGCATGMTDRRDLAISAPAVALPKERTIQPAGLKTFEGHGQWGR